VDAQIEQFAQNLGLNVGDLALRRDQLTEQQRQALDQLNLQKSQLAQQQSQFESTQTTNLGMFEKELAQKAKEFGLTQQHQIALANLDRQTKLDMANLEAQNKNMINSNENVAGAWGTMMQNIANIQNNANLEAPAKEALIRNNIESFRSFATFIGSTANIDVSELLNFSIAPGGAGPAPRPSPAPSPNDDYNGNVGGEGGGGGGGGGGD
jgi:hypothetical protein